VKLITVGQVKMKKVAYPQMLIIIKWLLIFTFSLAITLSILIFLFQSMSWWYAFNHPVSTNQTSDGGFDLAGASSVFLYAFLMIFLLWLLSAWVSYKVIKKIFYIAPHTKEQNNE